MGFRKTANQTQRQSAASQSQAQRQSYSSQKQAQRQQYSNTNVQSRQTTAQNDQGTYYGSGYHPPAGSYPPPAARAEYYDEHTWDDGEVAAVGVGAAALGAVGGYAAGKSSASSTTTAAAPPPSSGSGGLPCVPNTAVVKGVTYYQCGSNWYTQAYGSGGVMYIPVPPPSAY